MILERSESPILYPPKEDHGSLVELKKDHFESLRSWPAVAGYIGGKPIRVWMMPFVQVQDRCFGC